MDKKIYFIGMAIICSLVVVACAPVDSNTSNNHTEVSPANNVDSSEEEVAEVEEIEAEEYIDSDLDEYIIDASEDEIIPILYQTIIENDCTMDEVEKYIEANQLVVYKEVSDNVDSIYYYNISTVETDDKYSFNKDFGNHYSIRIQHDEYDGSMLVELRSPEGKTIETEGLHGRY